jgi:hypothetical protein
VLAGKVYKWVLSSLNVVRQKMVNTSLALQSAYFMVGSGEQAIVGFYITDRHRGPTGCEVVVLWCKAV